MARSVPGAANWRWHVDELFVTTDGEGHHLWRAVDHDGELPGPNDARVEFEATPDELVVTADVQPEAKLRDESRRLSRATPSNHKPEPGQ